MKASAVFAIILLALIGTITGAALLFRDRLNAQQLPVYGKAPAFEMTDSQGGRFQSSSLSGKPYVINFFFSHCEGVCPTTNGAMARIARATSTDAVRFVSVSVDPARDTPEALKEYAQRFKANPEQWIFVTGTRASVDQLLNDLKLGTSEDIAQHSSRLVLVDANSSIRGYYQGTDDESVQTLQRELQSLIR